MGVYVDPSGRGVQSAAAKINNFAVTSYKEATWQRYCHTRRKWVDRTDHEHMSAKEIGQMSQRRMDPNRRYQSLEEAYDADELGARRFRQNIINKCDGDEVKARSYVRELQRLAERGPCPPGMSLAKFSAMS